MSDEAASPKCCVGWSLSKGGGWQRSFAGVIQEGSLKHGVRHGCGHPHPARTTSIPLGRSWQPRKSSRLCSCTAVSHRQSEPVSKTSHFQRTSHPNLGASEDLTVCYQAKLLTLLLNIRRVWRYLRVVFSQPRWSPLLQDGLLVTGKVTGKGASLALLARSPFPLQGEVAASQA